MSPLSHPFNNIWNDNFDNKSFEYLVNCNNKTTLFLECFKCYGNTYDLHFPSFNLTDLCFWYSFLLSDIQLRFIVLKVRLITYRISTYSFYFAVFELVSKDCFKVDKINIEVQQIMPTIVIGWLKYACMFI